MPSIQPHPPPPAGRGGVWAETPPVRPMGQVPDVAWKEMSVGSRHREYLSTSIPWEKSGTIKFESGIDWKAPSASTNGVSATLGARASRPHVRRRPACTALQFCGHDWQFRSRASLFLPSLMVTKIEGLKLRSRFKTTLLTANQRGMLVPSKQNRIALATWEPEKWAVLVCWFASSRPIVTTIAVALLPSSPSPG